MFAAAFVPIAKSSQRGATFGLEVVPSKSLNDSLPVMAVLKVNHPFEETLIWVYGTHSNSNVKPILIAEESTSSPVVIITLGEGFGVNVPVVAEKVYAPCENNSIEIKLKIIKKYIR
jgi:hypothetical protein